MNQFFPHFQPQVDAHCLYERGKEEVFMDEAFISLVHGSKPLNRIQALAVRKSGGGEGDKRAFV